MLDINEEILKFDFIDVESLENKIGAIPDDMKESIGLYNKALEDLKSNNEDIAIIALKKAISIYPAFYEAMNLMGICYLSLDEEDNARKMFNKVIQMDDNSIRASKYLDRLDGKTFSDDEKNIKPRRPKKSTNTASWLKSGFTPEQKTYSIIKYIIPFAMGILLMCLVWILVPASSPITVDFGNIFKRTVDMSPRVDKLEKENLELNNRLNNANEALKKANETEKQLRDQIEQYTYWSNILRNLQKLADQGKYKDVVIQIERDLAGLAKPEAIEAEINDLNNECKPKAVSQFYDAGREIYRSNSKAQTLERYQEAANEYMMAIMIIEELEEMPNNAVNIYYYGGKAIALSQYPSKDEAEKEAIRCFTAVTEIAPRSEIASYARSRIRELEDGKTISH